MNEFGNRVKLMLMLNNMNQKELAEKMGITQASMTRYIKGQRDPRMSDIIKMSEILKISADYLLGIKQESGVRDDYYKIQILLERSGKHMTMRQKRAIISALLPDKKEEE